MRFRGYALTTLAAAISIALATAVVSVVIDPYGLFDLVRIDGINAKKAYAYTHKHLAKQTRALRLQPKTVLLGNSRVDVGFDPQSLGWPASMQPVANLGIPGDGMDRLAVSYDFTARRLKPEVVYIGLDFFDFLSAVPPRADTRLPLLSSDAGDVLAKLPETVFSTTALLDSVKTLAAQYNGASAAMTVAGFNPMRNYEATVRHEGQWPMVDFQNRQQAQYLADRPPTVRLPNGEPAAPLANLRAILSDAASRGQRVVGFTYPMHGHFYARLAVSGRWQLFEEWKRAVLAEWQAVKGRHPQWPTELWDFALLVPETTEPAPLPGHRDRLMQWYWEPGHFKSVLGDRLISQMTGTAKDGFGVRLTPSDVDEHLAHERLALDGYLRSHPDDVAYLKGLCQRMGCLDAAFR